MYTPSGHTTQIIVGANNESDYDILTQTYKLKNKYHTDRSYFSTFIPVKNTPFEEKSASNPLRTSRLYQAEYMESNYKINPKKFIYDSDGNLRLDDDPKMLLAQQNMELYPLDINTASYKQLIQIPGIGLKTAKRIMCNRRINKKVESMQELQNMGANINRAETFIKIKKSYQSTLI